MMGEHSYGAPYKMYEYIKLYLKGRLIANNNRFHCLINE